jgi:heme-degrading monooxygenase HmoA
MSITAIVHFPVADVAKAIEGLQANAALLEEITEDTKSAGILHHRFIAGAAELVVIDEWETAEQFQKFFEGNPKVERVTTAIGVTGPPTVTVYNSFEAAGAF